MARIPSKCPKCGRAKAWQKIRSPSTSGIIVKGLFAETIKRAIGYYKVTYKCSKCGFQEEYELPR